MVVVSVHEINTGRDGSKEYTKGKGITRQFTRSWRVQTSDPYDDAFVAMGVCPPVGAVHPSVPTATLKSAKATPHEVSKTTWIVTATYSTVHERETPNASDDPLNEPAKYEWSTDLEKRAFLRDIDGKAILNSAGDPPNPPLEGDASKVTVTVTKNFSWIPTSLIDYRNAVNADAVVIDGIPIAAGYAKVSSLKIGALQYTNDGWPYRSVSITLQISDSVPWQPKILDRGFNEIVRPQSLPATKIAITLGDGTRPKEPVLLDGNGGQLANPSPMSAVYFDAKIYRELPFSFLFGGV